MQHFKPNQPLRARDLNQLSSLAQRQALQGPSAATYNNGNGVVVRNPRRPARRIPDPAGTNQDFSPALITGGSSAAGYTVDLYANGFASGKTGTGTMFLPEVACDNSLDLSVGTAVLAHAVDVTITGGS